MSDVLTEEEAKSKWCPLVRVTVAEDMGGKDTEDWIFTAVNRATYVDDTVKNSKCIGSGCMAWHTVFSASPNDRPKGFCGAFGRPAGA